MTTKAAEDFYLEQHQARMFGKKWAIYNPKNKPLSELPPIYGFNNGGSHGFYRAQLIAKDGTTLGNHACSNEGYMEDDLGILEGSAPDRHEDFKKHYPDGYRMEFVTYDKIEAHEGLKLAFKRNEEMGIKALKELKASEDN